MKIGIIGAMAQEISLLSQSMTHKKEVVHHHLTFLSGQIANKDVVVVQCGIGKVASAIATTLLVTHFHVDYVINTGSAGSLSHHLHVGDVVIGHQLAYHDVDVCEFGYAFGQVPQMPLFYNSSQKLIDAAQQALQNTNQRAVIGTIVSSDGFVSKTDHINHIKLHFPDALCTEMEGASIAQTCHILNVPFVVVRAISDSANEEATVSFDEFIVLAGEKSAQMVMKILEVLS